MTKLSKENLYWAWLGKISVIFSAGWKFFGSSISVQKIQTGWTWLESHFFALVLCQEDLSSPACKWKTKWAGLYVVIFLDWFQVSWWLCTWFPSSHPVLFFMSWLYLLLTFSKYISFFLVWLKIKLFFWKILRCPLRNGRDFCNFKFISSKLFVLFHSMLSGANGIGNMAQCSWSIQVKKKKKKNYLPQHHHSFPLSILPMFPMLTFFTTYIFIFWRT